MTAQKVDLVVVGGGPGGYVAAIRGAQLGLRVVLVEREHLGGICLNWGCIPTKALLRSAEVYQNLLHAESFGLTATGVGFDLTRIVQRSRAVAAQLNAGVKHLLKKNRVEVVEGHARLAGAGVVEVETPAAARRIAAAHIILATGARARAVAPIEPDGKLVWSYKEAMTPAALPHSLLVFGSGAIGMEFASFYRGLGVEVTVVELLDHVLPAEDEEISALARKAFEQQGMTIHTSARVKALRKEPDAVVATVTVDGRDTALRAQRAIAAVGIVGNVERLGLENTRVLVEASHIVTDAWGATAEPGVYAIGDVAAPPWLAHKASHEAVVCVEKLAGVAGVQALDKTRIAGCTYTRPQVASIGLTEAAAKAAGRAVRIGRFPFAGNGKAIALGEAQGLVKTVFDASSGELLGAHMIGPEVTELIQGYVIGKTLETTEAELMHTVFPHPTLSEAMHEATLAAYGRAIHI